MAILHYVALFALRPLASGAARALGVAVADEAVGSVVGFLVERFSDHSQQLTEALRRSSDRAWRALEIALAGESLLSWLDRQEDKAFREQLRQFLTALPPEA